MATNGSDATQPPTYVSQSTSERSGGFEQKDMTEKTSWQTGHSPPTPPPCPPPLPPPIPPGMAWLASAATRYQQEATAIALSALARGSGALQLDTGLSSVRCIVADVVACTTIAVLRVFNPGNDARLWFSQAFQPAVIVAARRAAVVDVPWMERDKDRQTLAAVAAIAALQRLLKCDESANGIREEVARRAWRAVEIALAERTSKKKWEGF